MSALSASNNRLEQSRRLSICLVTFNRPELLTKTLNSIYKAAENSTHTRFQLLIHLNGEDGVSEALVRHFFQEAPKNVETYFEQSPLRRKPSEARNCLIKKASATWTVFLDDDILLPVEFFNAFVRVIKKHPEVSMLGGPNLTPLDSTPEEKMNGWILSQPLASGPIAFRYRKGSFFGFATSFKLCLCNLFVKTELVRKIRFSDHLFTGEENTFMNTALNFGEKAIEEDSLFVWHYRRKSFKSFLSQIEQYGFGRGQILAESKKAQLGMATALFISLFLLMKNFLWLLVIGTIWSCLVQFLFIRDFKKIDSGIYAKIFAYWFSYTKGIARGLWENGYLFTQKKFVN